MTTRPNRRLAILALILLAGSLSVTAASLARDDDPPPLLPADTLATSIELLYARPFLLDEPAVHASRAGQPSYDAGVLLVIEVGDRSLIHPRQLAMPILYVGDETAERINSGHESGRLVVIVPSTPDGDGGVTLDLATAPIFFGTPGLPEQVDAATIAAEREAAESHGIVPPSPEAVAAALQPTVRFADLGDVHLYAADLVEGFSPMETELVEGLRVPRLQR